MGHPTSRVLMLLELLQASGNRSLSGPQLAERLGVHIRTVRHYLNLLEDIGIPLEVERGRYGGYRLRPGFRLPPLMFSPEEAIALTIGLRFAARHGVVLAAPAVEGALAKVERALPPVLRERVQAAQQSIRFADPVLPYPSPDGEILLTLGTAVQNTQRVYLRYGSLENRRTGQVDTEARKIDPYSVVGYGGRWYIVAFCHRRNDIRVFRVDRVEAATLTEETFASLPPDFDPLKHVRLALASTPGIYTVEVLLRTTLEVAERRISPALALLEATEEGVLMRCHVQQLYWIAHYLIGLEFPVVVRQPPELRGVLQEVAERAIQMAQSRG